MLSTLNEGKLYSIFGGVSDAYRLDLTAYVTIRTSNLHEMEWSNHHIEYITSVSRPTVSVPLSLEVMIAVRKVLGWSCKCKRCEMDEWSCIMCIVS